MTVVIDIHKVSAFHSQHILAFFHLVCVVLCVWYMIKEMFIRQCSHCHYSSHLMKVVIDIHKVSDAILSTCYTLNHIVPH